MASLDTSFDDLAVFKNSEDSVYTPQYTTVDTEKREVCRLRMSSDDRFKNVELFIINLQLNLALHVAGENMSNPSFQGIPQTYGAYTGYTSRVRFSSDFKTLLNAWKDYSRNFELCLSEYREYLQNAQNWFKNNKMVYTPR